MFPDVPGCPHRRAHCTPRPPTSHDTCFATSATGFQFRQLQPECLYVARMSTYSVKTIFPAWPGCARFLFGSRKNAFFQRAARGRSGREPIPPHPAAPEWPGPLPEITENTVHSRPLARFQQEAKHDQTAFQRGETSFPSGKLRNLHPDFTHKIETGVWSALSLPAAKVARTALIGTLNTVKIPKTNEVHSNAANSEIRYSGDTLNGPTGLRTPRNDGQDRLLVDERKELLGCGDIKTI